jgi:hypothetical protein
LVDVSGAGPLYTGGKRWAEPREDQAAEYMRHVFAHRAEARALGERAQTDTRERLSLRAAGERMVRRLREIAARQAGLGAIV